MSKKKTERKNRSIIVDPFFCLLCMVHSCKHKRRNKNAKTAFHHDGDNDNQSGGSKTRRSSKRPNIQHQELHDET